MPSFCIVVQRGHEDLYDALRQAFETRPGFYVLLDRRVHPPVQPRRRDRRATQDDWGAAHVQVAECWEPFGSG